MEDQRDFSLAEDFGISAAEFPEFRRGNQLAGGGAGGQKSYVCDPGIGGVWEGIASLWKAKVFKTAPRGRPGQRENKGA